MWLDSLLPVSSYSFAGAYKTGGTGTKAVGFNQQTGPGPIVSIFAQKGKGCLPYGLYAYGIMQHPLFANPRSRLFPCRHALLHWPIGGPSPGGNHLTDRMEQQSQRNIVFPPIPSAYTSRSRKHTSAFGPLRPQSKPPVHRRFAQALEGHATSVSPLKSALCPGARHPYTGLEFFKAHPVGYLALFQRIAGVCLPLLFVPIPPD